MACASCPAADLALPCVGLRHRRFCDHVAAGDLRYDAPIRAMTMAREGVGDPNLIPRAENVHRVDVRRPEHSSMDVLRAAETCPHREDAPGCCGSTRCELSGRVVTVRSCVTCRASTPL